MALMEKMILIGKDAFDEKAASRLKPAELKLTAG